ncbi:unnamed protein product [Oikopleura dioica]|uniref:Uncharacterized protein n=1 Tax=Oikopleura dioica TaxID=34765 RepID=E4WWN9_OIKDI|nr:unnamed protein product [Oikopleura dioica]
MLAKDAEADLVQYPDCVYFNLVYITLLQIVVTYVNNILLLHKYSKRTIVSGSYGVYNQSESLVSCMLGWSIFNTLIHICSFAWWVYEEIQPGYCGGSSSFLDCIFIPNVCLPILAVSSILCIVCLIRMKIHFTNLARVTGSSLMEIQASSSVRQSKTAKPLPPTSRQSVNVPPNLSEETRRFSMQTKKNTLVTEYSSPYQESFSSLPQRPFSQ